MLPAGFEHAFPASERPQADALHCEATGIGTQCTLALQMKCNVLGVFFALCVDKCCTLPALT